MSGPNRYCSARRPDLDGDTSMCDDEGRTVIFLRNPAGGPGIALVRCWACLNVSMVQRPMGWRTAPLPKGVRT